MFVRTIPHSEDNSNTAEARTNEEDDDTAMSEDVELGLMLDQPPPDYDDVLLSDLPNYESLNIKHFALGRKVFIIDKSFKMTYFRVSDQV